ncbi:hypothetical protein QCM77_24195 [Bradyrhizobium sp. SSUT18]|uniref:hypothetical protein n=1 Tax=unclassified Bradyrhizobium TaxID=2631580 RepID=UPI0024477A4E|nr:MULTISPECIES: hypothetical protein [unclassified Bradyrhizobium]MDH2354587.1 hypothetical protein [Bradyrhizobium sp. SSUT112]MDH2403032.1 hypothetical protein [Bradyrhizobium sp. SSUT18]
MKHTASTRFWKAYEALPVNVQRLADANFKLLKSDPTPSLASVQTGRTILAARVGLRYRALAIESDGACVWFWIGSHADYDHLIG